MAKTTKGRSHVIRRLEQVRALAHPLRLRLFEAFARGPKTTKQAAEMLGLPPTRLYHHAQALERAGLIRLKETRPNRGTIEKHYEAVAEQLSLDPDVFSGRGRTATAVWRRLRGTGGALAVRVLEMAKDDLESSLRATATGATGAAKAAKAAGAAGAARAAAAAPMALRVGIRTTPKKIAAVHRQLLRLIEKIKRDAGAADDADDACQDASLTIAFVPNIAPTFAPPRATKARRAKPSRRKDS